MRRLASGTVLFALLLAGFPALVVAQENESGKKAGEESGADDLWRVMNFVIMAGGVAYLIVKNAGPYFAARSEKIREEIVRGEEARQDADQAKMEQMRLRQQLVEQFNRILETRETSLTSV